jgi:hypothetical protein
MLVQAKDSEIKTSQKRGSRRRRAAAARGREQHLDLAKTRVNRAVTAVWLASRLRRHQLSNGSPPYHQSPFDEILLCRLACNEDDTDQILMEAIRRFKQNPDIMSFRADGSTAPSAIRPQKRVTWAYRRSLFGRLCTFILWERSLTAISLRHDTTWECIRHSLVRWVAAQREPMWWRVMGCRRAGQPILPRVARMGVFTR